MLSVDIRDKSKPTNVPLPTTCFLFGIQGRDGVYNRALALSLIWMAATGMPHKKYQIQISDPVWREYALKRFRWKILPMIDNRPVKMLQIKDGDKDKFVHFNFPYVDPKTGQETEPNGTDETTKTYVRALMDWFMYNGSCDLTILFIHGNNILTYPFNSVPEPPPDADTLSLIASSFVGSSDHLRAKDISPICSRQQNPDYAPMHDTAEPISQGGLWYPKKGTLEDWVYLKTGSPVLTAYYGCSIRIQSSNAQNPTYFKDPTNAMITAMSNFFVGVAGFVRDVGRRPLQGARVQVAGREPVAQVTGKEGQFWRILPPGNYTIRVTKDGYPTTERHVMAHVPSASYGIPDVITRVDVIMDGTCMDFVTIATGLDDQYTESGTTLQPCVVLVLSAVCVSLMAFACG